MSDATDNEKTLAGIDVDTTDASAALSGPAAAESKLRFFTAKEACEQAPMEIPWLIDGYLPGESLIQVIGQPKLGGKTTTILEMAHAMVNGGTFLDSLAEKTDVVYCTEGPELAFTQSLRERGLDQCENLHLVYRHQCAGLTWEEIVYAAALKCAQVDAKLLVFDTLGEFLQLRGDAENNASVVLQKMSISKEVVAQKIAVLLVMHERKSGGDNAVVAGRGSGAFAGAVDVIMHFSRPHDPAKRNFRVMEVEGRFAQIPHKTVMELVDGHYRLRTEEDIKGKPRDEAEQAILDVAPPSEDKALERKVLLELAGLAKTKGGETLQRLVTQDRLMMAGSGAKGDPYVYWKPSDEENDSAAPGCCRRASRSAEI